MYCKKLLKEANIDVGEIEPVTVDFTLSEFDKSSTSSIVLKVNSMR